MGYSKNVSPSTIQVGVSGPASATSGRVAVYDGTTGKLLQDGTKAEADLVVGPATATDGAVALFDQTTGKLLKDGPVPGAASGIATLDAVSSLTYAQIARAVRASNGLGNLLVFDTFSRADTSAGSLGNAESGQAWTVHDGNMRVIGNKVTNNGTAVTGNATIDALTPDVFFEFTLTASPNANRTFGRAICRFIDSSNFLILDIRSDNILSNVNISKRESGVNTALVNAEYRHFNAGTTVRVGVSMIRNQMTLLINGVVAVAHTLSSGNFATFSTQTKHGISFFGFLTGDDGNSEIRDFALWGSL
jgi:hypothetical protein